MDSSLAIERRRMVHTIRDDPGDNQTVERILTAVLHGPSIGFSQGFAFLALDSPWAMRQSRWGSDPLL